MLSTVAALNRLSSLDTIGISDQPLTIAQEESEALEQFYVNIKFSENRYIVTWPWRQYPPELPSNLGLAFGQLKSLIKQHFEPSPEIFKIYAEILSTQIKEGIIEEIEYDHKTSGVHYLPHHPVIKPNKNTPIRIVYNGSAKTKGGKRLNQCIYKGKNLLTDLCGIVLRFRLNDIVIYADIEHAYHQLLIAPSDRDYVRFLFVKDPLKPLTTDNIRLFRFLRVAFGIVASPFLLLAAIHYHLQKQTSPFKNQLIHNIYVDNLLPQYLIPKQPQTYIMMPFTSSKSVV